MHTPTYIQFAAAEHGRPMAWHFLRHAFVHTTYHLGHVRRLKFVNEVRRG